MDVLTPNSYLAMIGIIFSLLIFQNLYAQNGISTEKLRINIEIHSREIKQKFHDQDLKLVNALKNQEMINGDDYPEDLKQLYWKLLNGYGEIINSYSSTEPEFNNEFEEFQLYYKILSELEYLEVKADKLNDQILAHRQYLLDKIYHFVSSFGFQYMSWQSESKLSYLSQEETTLIITNKGICIGGEAGYQNSQFHFYLDGCLLYGTGGVKNTNQNVIENYQQSNIPAYGIKTGPGASILVSSSGSRIGMKLPMIYTIQKLSTPDDNRLKIKHKNPLAFMITLYSRWQFEKWYFQTEFGKYLKEEQSFWGIGLGKEF